MEMFFAVGLLVWIALGFYALGFLFRDELILRALVFAGTVFYILYYMFAAASPLWDAIFSSAALLVINAWMIVVIVRERSTFGIPESDLQLLDIFHTLTPGQFRFLMSKATRHTQEGIAVLTEEGQPVHNVYYVQAGPVMVGKGDALGGIDHDIFIGELTFLRGGGASATISVGPGAKYLSWSHAELETMMERKPAFRNAMIALFALDMANKVAKSIPVARPHALSQEATA